MSEILYTSVFQEVLLFRSESWSVSAAMERTLGGIRVGFLKQITGEQSWQNPDRAWMTPEAGEVLGEAEMQLVAMYIGHRYGTVTQWVDLRPIFEVYARYQGYRGGGEYRRRRT